MLNRLIRWALANRALVLGLSALITLLGVFTGMQLPVEVLPDLTKPTVVILTEAPGLAPEEVETRVTQPLESALLGVAGLTRLRSNSDVALSLIYVEFDWGNQFTANALAAAPISLNNTATRNSVYNPFGVGIAPPGNTVRYRGVDAGNRQTDYDKTDYRGLVGVRGTFANGWGYDTAYLKTNEALRLTEKNGVSNAAITAAINSGAFNPFALAGTTGTFRGKTWDNHAALVGALASGRKPFDDTLDTYDFKLFGPAMELPAGPVNVALGYEWRYSHSTYQPDPIYFQGDLLGYNSGNPFDASAKNNAFYGEVAVPVLSAKNNVAFVKDLSVTGNIRYDNASVHDNLNARALPA